MSAELNLIPDIRTVALTGIFLMSVFSAHQLIIAPSLRLHKERRKRTSGAQESAKEQETKAMTLEANYNRELDFRQDEAKKLRNAEILAGQAEAEAILSEANKKAHTHLESIQAQVAAEVASERARIPSLVEDVTKTIFTRLGLSLLALALVGASLHTRQAAAQESVPAATATTAAPLDEKPAGQEAVTSAPVSAEASATAATTPAPAAEHVAAATSEAHGSEHGETSFVNSTVWPLVQFALFAALVIFVGRGIIAGILQARRDQLRTRLSEAKQAVTEANKRCEEFERKIANLQSEIETFRTQFVQDGKREQVRIISEAQKESERIIGNAERAAQDIINKSKSELRKELLEQAISAVHTQLTADKLKVIDSKLRGEAVESLKTLA